MVRFVNPRCSVMKSFSLFLLPVLALALPDTPAALTLDEALARTAAQHPRLLAHEARLGAAAALTEQAGYAPNPVLHVTLENFAGSGAVRGVDDLESTVELSQSLERGGKRARRTALAEQDRLVAASEAAVTRAELLGATAEDYVAAVLAARRLQLSEELVALARTALANAEARRSAGDASAMEPARARAALASAQAESTRQAAALRLARQTLATHWSGDGTDAEVPVSSLALPTEPPPAASWLARLEQHPRLRLEQTRVAGKQAALELEQANATPDVNLVGGVRHLRATSDVGLVAGLSVPLPVRHRNQAAIRAARQTVAGAEFEAAAALRDLRAQFTRAWHTLAAAHTAARQVRDEALPASEESAALLRRAYAVGEAAQFEVLDAERVRAALRRELLELEAAYATALVRVETLADPAFPATRQLLSDR